jgi:hypothetical protein
MIGLGRLKDNVCADTPAVVPTPGLNIMSRGKNCEDFLAKERAEADIRYFVEWED